MRHQTKDHIISCAIRLMQEQGYSHLGLRELALEVGIKAPSLYNHFKSKTELVQTALFTYRELQRSKLNEMNQLLAFAARLHAYVALFHDMLIDDGYACFAMILTLEKKHLTPQIRQEIDAFYAQNIQWLEHTWQEGLETHAIESCITPPQAAKIIFGACEGMMLFAANNDDTTKQQFIEHAHLLLKQLGVKTHLPD